MGSDFPTSGSGLYAYEESSRMGESEFLSLSGKIDLGISRGQENPHWILFYKKKQTKNTLVVHTWKEACPLQLYLLRRWCSRMYVCAFRTACLL